MKYFILPALLCCCVLLCSCRTGKTTDGRPCVELSAAEQAELQELARLSLSRPGRQLTADEVRIIQTAPPEVRIRYNGDCCGTMTVHWNLNGKKAGVFYRGLLNDHRKREMIFEIIPDMNRVLYKGVPGKRDTAR